MQMFKILSMMMIVLLLGLSCKSTRMTATGKIASKTNVNNDIATDESLGATSESDECYTDNSEATDSLYKETLTTKWSVPDSSGVQYPIETIDGKETHVKKSVSDVKLFAQTKSGMNTDRRTEDNSKIEELLKNKSSSDNESEDETHNWAVYGTLAAVAGVFIWGIMILWRLRRKKPPSN